MKIALVYDRVNKYGGAERVLSALHEIWPKAPLYTAVYDRIHARWADVFTVNPSFLQHIPLANTHHEWLAWATPLAFESFQFTEYDVVISITSAEAKAIITQPQTLHICYCLTPTRYLWSGRDDYLARPGLGEGERFARWGLSTFGNRLREWDIIASSRPDKYVAISHTVQSRIEQYYNRTADAVIYPPVEVDKFKTLAKKVSRPDNVPAGYFLAVARLVSYKRLDLVIAAFNILQLPLVIIGDGKQRNSLQKQADSTIIFVSRHLTDEELVGYYGHCRAFVFAGAEDFGIAAVETQVCGKPVIAYRKSGLGETVIDGKTGILFDEQTVDSIVQAIHAFAAQRFSSHDCLLNAERFNKERFKQEFSSLVSNTIKEYNKI